MNRLPGNGDRSAPLFTRVQLPKGFEVCWAGPQPFRDGFCFGSDDGRLLFTDEKGAQLRLGAASDSGEAINGVAGVGTAMAVSTRQEVNLFPLLDNVGGHDFSVVIPHGAHGITTTPSGYFIAPLGRTGIMTVKPPLSPSSRATVYSDDGTDFSAYRVISLHSAADGEVMACAGRLGGIGAAKFSGGQQTQHMTTVTFKALDIVDLCALRSEADSLAVAALGRDGTLILFQDILHDRQPLRIRYDAVEGVAYRILSCRGDIFLLTSKALYLLAGLAGRFVAGEPVEGVTTPVFVVRAEGVDANLCGEEWLLVVTPDEVRKFDVRLMHDSTPQDLSQGEIRDWNPKNFPLEAERRHLQQRSTRVPAGAA